MSYRPAWILGLAAACIAGSAFADPSVPIDRCSVGSSCAVQGKLVASERMGSIRDGTGCIAVALPATVTDDWNLRTVKASGTIYRAPDLPGLTSFKVKDRTVDAEACYSGLVMYVDSIRRVEDTAR